MSSSIGTIMEFLGNLLKLVAWGKLGELHPFTQGDEPKRIAAEFEKFAGNGFCMTIVQNIIHLGKVVTDRTKPFNPAEFIVKGWTIWKGPADGDGLTGDEEQDAQALALTEVDITTLLFETTLRENESVVNGEEKLRRLKESGRIRLDAKFGQALLDEPGRVTLVMLRITRGITWFDLPGTVLRDSNGRRYVLCLYWNGGAWNWRVRWLVDGFRAFSPSAVLASSSPAAVSES